MYIFGILALIFASFVLYKILASEQKVEMPSRFITETQAVVNPTTDSGRKVALWLTPITIKSVGRCGPPLNCCGDLFA